MTFLRLVFVAIIPSTFLVGGSQCPHESLTETLDETVLLQAAVIAKSGAGTGGAEEVKSLVCEEEKVFNFSLDRSFEQADISLESGATAAAPFESHEAEPDPELVAIVRQVLWLISAAIAFNGATKWRPQKSRKFAGKPTAAKCVAKPSDSAPQRSALHKAALAGDDVRCESLLRRAPNTLAIPDSWGTTALHAAAAGGSRVVVELFLERGAPVDPVNSWDETPLHLAARGGHVQVCELLVRNGASLHACNAEDRTPLVVAGFEEQDAACRSLLALGAGVDGMADQDLPDFLRDLMAR